MTFKTTVDALQTFTSDKTLLESVIRQTVASGDTAIYDTVSVTLDAFRRVRKSEGVEPRRRAILLVTDGVDSASLTSLDDLLDTAAHSDVTMYAIGMLPRTAADDGPRRRATR